MITRRLLLAALAVSVAALSLRLPFLGADLFHTDSVFQARAVESWVIDGKFEYMHRPGYPGQVLLSAPVFWLHHALTGAPSAAFAVTLQSALAGALAAGLMVIFARPFLRSDAAAAAAGLVAAALPTLLSTTTFAMSHGTQVALLLGAGGAAARATRGGAVCAGALLGLAVATRTESVFFAPALLALHWRTTPPIAFDREHGFRLTGTAAALGRDLALFVLPMALVPLALYAQQFSAVGLAEWREAAADTGWLGPVSSALPLGFSGVARSLTWGGLALALGGMVAVWQRDRPRALVLLLWCVLPFIFLANTRIIVPRHLIPALVTLAIPIAAALEWIAERSRLAAGLALTGLLVWMVVPLVPTLTARSHRCLPAAFARAAGKLVPTGGVVIAMDLRPHLEYFGGLTTLGHDALDGTTDDEARIAGTLAEINAALAAGTPVFVASDAFAYDAPHPDHGILRVKIGSANGGAGEELVGRLGIAFIETFEFEHVLTTNFEDWHGAALGPRHDAGNLAHLYRILPAAR